MRLCLIEYGDVRDALTRMKAGAAETYRAQYYSLLYILGLRARSESISYINIGNDEPFDELIEGIRAIGFNLYAPGGEERMIQMLEDIKPTHIVLRSPLEFVLRWARENDCRVLPMLADSFSRPPISLKGFKQWRWTRGFVKSLNDPSVTLVANHNVAACRDLAQIGVAPDKIIPWDWPSVKTPADYETKALGDTPPYNVLYVGLMTPRKGVDDLIDAFAQNEWLSANVTLTLVGGGYKTFADQVEALGLEKVVTFTGTIANSEVMERMQKASIVAVPSRHDYPEGLPGTIYEALTVRTPLLLSDHPMFRPFFKDGDGVRVAPAKNPAALGDVLVSMLSDPGAYAALSQKTADAFEAISCPHAWADVIEHWLNDDAEGYLAQHRGAWAVTPAPA
ncbi:glycosyltransferase [Parvularcula sp. LCG005]|uniref:glycosyltransferase n=1 Tax=Parvularcula sp. LCG005 TaxID=3078805 RepID=UPI0029431F81|nr:glycosyltransferase [Parvularcula sp. LCG005]WOI54461.1 glycosyltransferase [Parvularcula sp. LCG005]